MMSLRTPLLSLTLITLFTTLGASGTKWSVKYNQTQICALNGSTVSLSGTYTHPANLEVKREYWVLEKLNSIQDKPIFCNVTTDSGRVQCYVDKHQNFSLRLSDVTKEDEHEYRFRIITNKQKEKWVGHPGIKLKITELCVDTTQEVMEGNTTVLTCTTSCSLTDPSFIWYRNGRPLSNSTNTLHLQPVSSEDAGSYRCAVRGYEHLPSPVKNLTVTYPPKKVSISPSGEIVEGSSVTLTCSSDANPPVQNYTWFKEGGTSPVASGQNYTITNITAEHTGLYYCLAQNEYGSLNRTVTITINGTVTINVKRDQRLFSVWISVGGGAFILVIVFIWIYRKKKNLRENDNDRTSQDDVQYATVTPSTSRPVQDNVLYANVTYSSSKPVLDNVHCDGVTSTDQQGEPQYASFTFQSHTAASGTPSQKMEESSVLYGTVRTD